MTTPVSDKVPSEAGTVNRRTFLKGASAAAGIAAAGREGIHAAGRAPA
jgi:hypothetical protein